MGGGIGSLELVCPWIGYRVFKKNNHVYDSMQYYSDQMKVCEDVQSYKAPFFKTMITCVENIYFKSIL